MEEEINGKEGLSNYLSPGSFIIDMSSISPSVTQRIESVLKEKEINFIVAPVSEGQSVAINGTLTIMVGGLENLFEEAKNVLAIVGQRIVHCEEIGAGQTVKVVNQLMSAVIQLIHLITSLTSFSFFPL